MDRDRFVTVEAYGDLLLQDKEVVTLHCRMQAALAVAGREPGLELAVLYWHPANGH